MGMFDSFYFIGDSAKLVRCAGDHMMTGELQTKDLDCTMAHYCVYEGILFKAFNGLSNDDLPISYAYEREGDHLVVITRENRALDPLTGDVSMYAHCSQCEPVFYESSVGGLLGSVAHRFPWCQWVVRFDQGRMIWVDAYRCESQKDVVDQLEKSGLTVIPNTDCIVRKELEKWRRGEL